jgi:hypothetical protein
MAGMRSGDPIRGRHELVVTILGGALTFALIAYLAWWRSGEIRWLTAAGRPLGLAGLGVLAANGQRWARTTATLWMGLTAVVVGFGAVTAASVSVGAGVFMFAIALIFAVAAFRLQTSPHVDAYLAGPRNADRPHPDAA